MAQPDATDSAGNENEEGGLGVDNAEAPYLLARHVHLCICGPHAVLMDLRRDKYVAVSPAHLLAHWVRGWPGAQVPSRREAPGDERADAARARSLISQMLEQGMLVGEGGQGRPAAPLVIAPPERTLLEFDFDERLAAGPAEAARLALASMRARTALALRPMEAIVRAAQARKARVPTERHAADPGRERALVKTFVHLRPLFYTVRRACLLDSLTLVNFLAGHGVYPEWVFGVRTAPFDAHCWVQRGEVLFNDLPDRIRQYSPILKV